MIRWVWKKRMIEEVKYLGYVIKQNGRQAV